MVLKHQIYIYSIQQSTLKVDQKSSSKLSEDILVLGFRTTLMKGFDPLQMLTSVCVYIYIYIYIYIYTHTHITFYI